MNEAPDQTARLQSMLATEGAGADLRRIVSDLRLRYPQVQNAELENYLIGAYCPVVEQNAARNDQQKQADVVRFATAITQIIY
ncbi:MAG TPA: hypothetical protein VHS58_16660 [Acetobacteraceae bacterium]|nr:hypothetical protein [Acetobacteraceae bacterium]